MVSQWRCRTKKAFIGHTPIDAPRLSVDGAMKQPFLYDKAYPLPGKGLLGIDTECYETGVLSAALIENGDVRFIKNSKP